MDLRYLFNISFYILTIVFVIAALLSNELTGCHVNNGMEQIPTASTLYYSYNHYGSHLDGLRSQITYGQTFNGNTLIPKYPGNLPIYAQTSFISQILAASFLLLLIIVYLKTDYSIFSQILANLVTLTLLLAAIMATLLHTEADYKKMPFINMLLNSQSDVLSDTDAQVDPLTIQVDPCTITFSTIFSWVAVSTWLILFIERVVFFILSK